MKKMYIISLLVVIIDRITKILVEKFLDGNVLVIIKKFFYLKVILMLFPQFFYQLITLEYFGTIIPQHIFQKKMELLNFLLKWEMGLIIIFLLEKIWIK